MLKYTWRGSLNSIFFKQWLHAEYSDGELKTGKIQLKVKFYLFSGNWAFPADVFFDRDDVFSDGCRMRPTRTTDFAEAKRETVDEWIMGQEAWRRYRCGLGERSSRQVRGSKAGRGRPDSRCGLDRPTGRLTLRTSTQPNRLPITDPDARMDEYENGRIRIAIILIKTRRTDPDSEKGWRKDARWETTKPQKMNKNNGWKKPVSWTNYFSRQF